MEDLTEKVRKQGEEIDNHVIELKAAIRTLQLMEKSYCRKEYRQKLAILEGILETLTSLKINI